jgi:D-alanyl-D-alanine carboxypeptidase (penicillin-binding protein 5/6)
VLPIEAIRCGPYARAVGSDLIVPASYAEDRPRRRRRRYRLRRLTPVGVAVLLAGAGGAWIGSHQSPEPVASVATPRVSGLVAAPKVAAPKAAPERLLAGGALVSHTFAPKLMGAAAILVDAKTGRVVWADKAHQRRQVASTTKIMTALLAMRVLRPHDIVQVDKSVPRVPLVREGLRAGERVEAWKLFYALLLYSGNDDALALAIAAGGSKAAFVKQMNAEAATLGLHDTHFVSPSGVVDVDNYSSAWDLAALTRVAMRSARFRSIVRTHEKHVPWTAPTYSKIYINNNRLVGTYPGADGVKTGYTHKAGPCLVASAKRGGVSLIAVVLDSPDMYSDARRLLNFGFASLSA